MGMIYCPHCGNYVSDADGSCFICGGDLPQLPVMVQKEIQIPQEQQAPVHLNQVQPPQIYMQPQPPVRPPAQPPYQSIPAPQKKEPNLTIPIALIISAFLILSSVMVVALSKLSGDSFTAESDTSDQMQAEIISAPPEEPEVPEEPADPAPELSEEPSDISEIVSAPTEPEASTEIQEDIQVGEPDLMESYTMAQQNAIRAAKDYLSFSSFSRAGLIQQLSSEYGDGYSVEDATFAVDYLETNGLVDWNEQAAKAAEDYLEFTSFSREGLIDQLTSEVGDQFTQEQAEYGVSAVGF